MADNISGPHVSGGSASEVRLGNGDAPPSLPFEIVTVYEQQQLTTAAPWHQAGGKWTFFDAKLTDGTPFTVGLLETRRLKGDFPMVLFDGRLIAPTPEDGAKLSAAYGKAFHAAGATPASTKRSMPLTVNSVVLSENAAREADGSFGDRPGNWNASKWTIERNHHSEEVFFNYNLAEKKGEWSEKDQDYDADVAKDFMEVLHDGR